MGVDEELGDPRKAIARLVLELRWAMGGAAAIQDALAREGVLGDGGRPYTRGAVSNWINGVTTPPGIALLAMLRLADARGINLSRFIRPGREPATDPLVTELQERLERIEHLVDQVAVQRRDASADNE